MDVLELNAIHPAQRDLVGGKAADLAALNRLGERVPDGFCITTAAHHRGEVPREEVLAAYDRLGGGPVAVRSSATAEDLPDASFAGQQDTYLSVTGVEELLKAIHACWDSLHSHRAIAYRVAVGVAHESARMAAVVAHLLDDPRFAPEKGDRRRPGGAALTTAPKAAAGILRALARPAAARARVSGEIERLRTHPVADPSSAAELLDLVEEATHAQTRLDRIIWPVVSGLLVSAALPPLLKGIASDDEIHTVLGGMPYNVTIEMDLALWQVAQRATPYREILLHTPPDDLAAAHLAGELPDIGLSTFLDSYGHRSAAEVDVGVPRWSENPAPVFTMLANYLRVTDPEQAPDRRFQHAAARAEAMLAELTRRARRKQAVRGRVTGFFLRRSRELTGLREAGKFAGLYALRDRRRRLLLIGAELQASGLLERADDVMFLTLPELRAAVQRGDDLREVIAGRRSAYARELRRQTVPVALLSDGTDVEALLPARASDGHTLTGTGAASGHATGRARVVRSLASASIEPGEILVAPTTDPGWTPLFLTAGGLVTETGAVMAHGPWHGSTASPP